MSLPGDPERNPSGPKICPKMALRGPPNGDDAVHDLAAEPLRLYVSVIVAINELRTSMHSCLHRRLHWMA